MNTCSHDEITRTAEALYARGSLPDGIEWRSFAPTFTAFDEEPLATPVFGPPDMGTRALPQPPAPGALDRIEIRFRRDWFDLHCQDCGKWLNGWTKFEHSPITVAFILDLLSWLPRTAWEIHDCESR